MNKKLLVGALLITTQAMVAMKTDQHMWIHHKDENGFWNTLGRSAGDSVGNAVGSAVFAAVLPMAITGGISLYTSVNWRNHWYAFVLPGGVLTAAGLKIAWHKYCADCKEAKKEATVMDFLSNMPSSGVTNFCLGTGLSATSLGTILAILRLSAPLPNSQPRN